jgi:RNA-directed DNA polymerase
MMSEDSTGGTTSSKREAAQVMTEVGGVRSSDDPVPDLWSGKPAGERRDATCFAARKRNEELVTALLGLSAP